VQYIHNVLISWLLRGYRNEQLLLPGDIV